MMLPPPRRRIAGTTALVSTKAPTRLILSTSAKSAALISVSGARRRTAALFTSTSTPLYSLCAVSTSRAASASLATSPATAVAVPPALTMASTVSSRGSRRRPKTTTRAPSAANSSAVARPSPAPPPATSATFRSSEPMLSPVARAVQRIARAECLHRAARAPGRSRGAPGGPEVHQGLVPVVRLASREERLGQRPHLAISPKPTEPARAEEDAPQDAPHVGVHDGRVLAEGEGEDGACRVAADAAHGPEGVAIVGQSSAVAGEGLPGDALEVAGADVVAEGVPGPPHRRGARPCQAGERRIAPEEFAVLRDHALHLRLLEHDLRDEDVVGIVGVPPRQVTAVPAVPAEQPALEALPNRHV